MNHLKKLSLFCFVAVIALIINGCCVTKPNCDPDGGNFTYGPEVSYRIAKFTGKDAKDENTKSIGAIGLGAYIHWIFCEDYPQMGFYSGLFYNQFGGRWEYSGGSEIWKDRLHYLSIPFTYTYEVTDGLRIEAGPDVSFLLASKWIIEDNGNKETGDFKEDAASVQLGYNIGLSYVHEQSGLGGFFRWNGAFTSPYSSDYVDDTNFKVRNGGFSFGIRYGLNQLLSK